MKRIVLAFAAVALLASSASAGGFGLNLFGRRGVNVNVGGGFARQQVFVQQQPVFVRAEQPVFRQHVQNVQIVRSVPAQFYGQQVFRRQVVRTVPVYSSQFGFSGGYGNVQTFAAPVGGCGSFLSLGVGY